MNNDIAIVGMSCRFPGAKNIDEFWNNLKEGKESISFFSKEELLEAGIDAALLDMPQYVRAKGFLDKAEYFDAAFFGISPREAQTMDPQHKIFLECCWEALENAGYYSEDEIGRISILAGTSGFNINSYFQRHLSNNDDVKKLVGNFQLNINNGSDFLSTRASYKFNFTGPSYTLQAGCSTSLIAISQACQSLINYQCDMALAGAVTIDLPIKSGYLYQPGMILSPDGHCRAFDKDAQGTVPGNGAGVVVLRRLSDALESADHIYAVIKGFALNNDGAQKIGYTAPSMHGQAAVIAEAQAIAGFSPDTIGYVEAHGTGTKQGDPIELAGLIEAFGDESSKTAYCAIGSVKSNIGHLDATSGVAGLIKTALCLYHKTIPPTLFFETINPDIDLSDSPFYVNTRLMPWDSIKNEPRRAGVSSFGIGGTNAHVILEEMSQARSVGKKSADDWVLIPVSAKTNSALNNQIKALSTVFSESMHHDLVDIAYTYQLGRSPFMYRAVLIAKHHSDALETIGQGYGPCLLINQQKIDHPKEVVFTFYGRHRPCYPNMTWALYQHQTIFRDTIDHCIALIRDETRFDARALLYPRYFEVSEYPAPADVSLLQSFIIEYALAKLWIELGVDPCAVGVCGSDAYAAVCIAGVLSLEQALQRILLSTQDVLTNAPSTCPIITGEFDAVSNMDRWILSCVSVSDDMDESRVISLDMGYNETASGLATLACANDDELFCFSHAAAHLWLTGVAIQWSLYNQHQCGKKIPLPTYCFDQKRHWIDALAHVATPVASETEDALLARPLMTEAFIGDEIIKAWEKHLGVSSVSLNDDFFALGGDSLSANQTIVYLQQRLSIDCPINAIFHHPRGHDLARYLFVLDGSESRTGMCETGSDTRGLLASKPFFPLSFSQKRMWFLEQYEAGIYNIPIAMKLSGPLNIQALEYGFNCLLERHQALRSYFVNNHQSIPEQAIKPVYKLQLDVRTIQETEVSLVLHRKSHFIFNLLTGPLFNVVLFRLNAGEHILLMNQHHIISDGWSIRILCEELWRFYNAYLEGRVLELEPLTYQYADFCTHQQAAVNETDLKNQLDYWRANLMGIEPLNLPLDYPRPPIEQHAGKNVYLKFGSTLTQNLKKLSKDTRSTLFMVLLSGLTILLHKYCNQNDIVIGTPIANRKDSRLRSLIGFFVNTLILRNNLAGNPHYLALLADVRNVCLSAYDNQDVPFEQLLDILKVDRDTSRNALFQVMMIFQNYHDRLDLNLTDVKSELIHNEYDVSQMDLTFHISELQSDMTCRIEYNTSLFSEETIEKLAAHFKILLESIVANPNQSISGLSMLTAMDKRCLLSDWNATKQINRSEQTIHALFEQQVKLTPDAEAIFFENQSLTYHALNCRANHVAHVILDTIKNEPLDSANTEILIGLCVERGLDMVIGILGIMKAGAAYVPLDLSHPDYRLKSIIDDANIRLLITQQTIVQDRDFLSSCVTKIVCFEEMDFSNSLYSVENPSRPSTLAYTLFTSGSTGKPKGVMVNHRSVVNLLSDVVTKLNVGATDCLLSVSPYSFDISVLEFFVPLLSGGTLHLLSTFESRDPPTLAAYIQSHPRSIIQATPASWTMVADLLCDRVLDITILVGGEPLGEPLAAKLLQFAKKIWNVYGPTETTIWSTFHELNHAKDHAIIGQGFANTQLYVLDEYLNMLPSGILGELHISGQGLSRGYLHQEQLTQQSFIANPYSTSDEDKILYKTGDIVRWRHDGRLEYIGRRDSQVKIRGYRIELKEVEVALNKCASVKEGICVALNINGSTQLIAYYIPSRGSVPNVNEAERLRNDLSLTLPEYMLPTNFVQLDHFPLTVSGKIDRKQLPPPNQRDVSDYSIQHFAKSQYETVIAMIWCDLLKLERIDIDRNFFTLGGNSLLIAQVQGRLTQQGYKTSMVDHFQYPTIRLLANKLSQLNQAPAFAESPSIEQQRPDGTLSAYERRMRAKNLVNS